MLTKKIATIGLSMAIVLGAATPAAAVTVAELQAQINALMAQLASLSGGSATVGAAITSDLTVGSSGAQVSALQSALVAQGYLSMPVGVAMGYFGSLTKAAVMKWQAAHGVPATGYFGPLSRASFNGSAGVGGVVPGTTVGGGTSTGGITTPGVEGTLTVSAAASPSSGAKLYEGASKVPVLGIKLEAKTSDIKVERVKLDLDCSTCSPGSDNDFYRKIASRVYIMDGSTVLGSMDLNASTVTEDGADRFITVAGLSYVVPKNATRNLTVALDAYPNWDSTYNGDSWTVGVPIDGVRGVDGAGVNQYGPSAAFTSTFTSEDELSASATLTVSTSASTPQAREVIAAQGSGENELDALEVLKADFRAEKDNVVLTDLVVDMVRTGSGGATTTTGYLYDGNNLIASDAVDTDGHAGFTFSNIDLSIAKDTTKTLTVKVDVDSAANTSTTFAADIDTADITAENSVGDGITESGSAQGENVTVRNVGLEISLVSKSITKGTTQSQSNNSTSTVEAQFVLRVKAVGGDIVLGDAGSTTMPFISNAGGSFDDDPSFRIYRGGTDVTATLGGAAGVASSTSLTVPSGVTSVTNNSFTLQEGNTVDIPVSFTFTGRTAGGSAVTLGSYAVGISQLNWSVNNSATAQESTFMSGKSEWRTATVSLP